MIDTTAIDRWLATYVQAWKSDASEAVADLFEPDARYRTAPFRKPYVGHAAIVEWWIGKAESTIAWEFEYEVVAREGELYVVRGVTSYPHGAETPGAPVVFDNIWLVTLTARGRAAEFVEYWMQRD